MKITPKITSSRGLWTRLWRIGIPFTIILSLVLSTGCTSPFQPSPTQDTPVSKDLSPTPANQLPREPLPPTLVEAAPLPGSEIPLQASLMLSFDQPMNRESVEAAVQVEPVLGGRFSWQEGDRTLVFTPDQAFAPATPVRVTVKNSARGANGLSLLAPVSLAYHTAGDLRLTQKLPLPDALDVHPTSAVVAGFNQPIVPLGADSSDLPQAFDLEPAAPGRGEWLNTSTYIFYPDPALAGGAAYTVRLNPSLVSLAGVPLEVGSESSAWTFTTALPRLVKIEPDLNLPVLLDAPFTLTFNQPMDPASVESSFLLQDTAGQEVPGLFTWNEASTQATFKPEQLLRRSTGYTLRLSPQARSSGGTALETAYAASFLSVPDLAVVATSPGPSQQLNTSRGYANLSVQFSVPIRAANISRWITLVPAVSDLYTYVDETTNTLYISGYFSPARAYTLILSGSLPDAWGQTLGRPYVLSFNTSPAQPELILDTAYLGSNVIFLTPSDQQLSAQATNLSSLEISAGTLPLADFFTLLAPGGYEQLTSYRPLDQRFWSQPLLLQRDKTEAVAIPLTPEGTGLDPGLYHYSVQSPQLLPANGSPSSFPVLAVVSRIQATLKLSANEVLLWAVNLEDQSPLAGAKVVFYREDGTSIAEGVTDADGLLQTAIPLRQDPYQPVYALIEQPGEAGFGMALSTWNQGLSSWDFNIPADVSGPGPRVYLYTDRPIYRPGQTVYFRAVARHADNGRYSLPDQFHLVVELYGAPGITGQVALLNTFDLPLSSYGTTHGSFTLPEDALPGDYRLSLPELRSSDLYFQVVDYRKPEIDLQVTLSPQSVKLGDSLQSEVSARYFFGAPAGNLPVHWVLYRTPVDIFVPGISLGMVDLQWGFSRQPNFHSALGERVVEGEALTQPDGSLSLEVPTTQADREIPIRTFRYTLEVTMEDESGLPVSARAEAVLHPAGHYIGLRSESWSGEVEKPAGFTIITFDWERSPLAVEGMQARFQKVAWEEQETPADSPYRYPVYMPVTTLVGSTDFYTDAKGVARLAFTPAEPGVYLLDVTGGGAQSQVLLWVRGEGAAAWPEIPNQRLQLSADAGQDASNPYQVGQSARIFIPNPTGREALALVTVERGRVMRSQVVTVGASGHTLDLPILSEDAPNIYLSVTLLAGGRDQSRPDFRQGYINLRVDPKAHILNVELVTSPERTQPGGQVDFDVRVTDERGQPVRGEFSLAVVDEAVLALAEPNAPGIASAFYNPQPLGVQTSLSLAAYAGREFLSANGQGGGGNGMLDAALVVREDFPDTAYWNPQIVTDANGIARVSLSVPDSLTTWWVDLRGLTADTRVGEASGRVVVSKDLLVRPVAPRFMVVNDHLQLAAIVHNNTPSDLQVDVSLQGTGFRLDDPNQATQPVNLAAGGRSQVVWWGVAQDTSTADLVFAVQSGSYQDAARPVDGPIPIYRYSSPQTFATSGVLTQAGERLEVISIPRSISSTGGELRLEMAPSIAALVHNSLAELEKAPFHLSEPSLSRFLPGLRMQQAFAELGLNTSEITRLSNRTLKAGLSHLVSLQNDDGGWGWARGDRSSPLMTAYILFGLSQVGQSALSMDQGVIARAQEYLRGSLMTPQMTTENWELDRLAYIQFALGQSGAGEITALDALYEKRELLSPWAQAMLALSLDDLSSADPRLNTLISDLEANAIRSATGTHWEESSSTPHNLGSPVFTTAVVVYALAQRHPASQVLPGAVRYLISTRSAGGTWASTYETAWALMGLVAVLEGTGDLHSEYNYSASLNGVQILDGQSRGPQAVTPVNARLPFDQLDPGLPNALRLRRETGIGNLYYAAYLELNQPVENAVPVQRGLTLSRAYHPAGVDCFQASCESIHALGLGPAGQPNPVTVRLTLTLPHDAYHLVVEDYIPAGAEILNEGLRTSQLGLAGRPENSPHYDMADPYRSGWGWWYFSSPHISAHRIQWTAEYLPAGTYELNYTFIPHRLGEYRLLPARAWQYYFPEVQAASAGGVFEIKE